MPPSFQERKAKREAERKGAETMADKFRRARCPECQQPMLWHDGPDNERAKGVNCELKQEEIMGRLSAKALEETSDG